MKLVLVLLSVMMLLALMGCTGELQEKNVPVTSNNV